MGLFGIGGNSNNGPADGSVKVNNQDFYGVDTNQVAVYLEQIQAIAITRATEVLNDTNELFSALRDGWVGKAEENFETNFNTAKDNIIASLNNGYAALESEINQIGQGWIDQDAGMVQVQGGGQ